MNMPNCTDCTWYSGYCNNPESHLWMHDVTEENKCNEMEEREDESSLYNRAYD